MRCALVVVVALAACRDSGPAHRVIVNTFAGDRAEPGVTIVAHSPDGDVVDITAADPTGRAELGIDDDSLVSVIFPGDIVKVTPVISVITTVPPNDGSELTFHGPRSDKTPPLIVGVLQLDGPNLNAADYFNVTLGCVTVRVNGRLPAIIDVSSCNMGSDQNLDVLVRGYHDVNGVPQLDGYSAGRATMTNGAAMFDVPSWRTTGTAVAVTQTGVQAALTWTMRVDGLDFLSEPMGTAPYGFTGLMVDTTLVDAVLPAAHGARITMRPFMSTPTAIALADTDFLPTLEPIPAAPTIVPTTVQWDASTIAADALHMHAAWATGVRVAGIVPPGPHLVVWDAVLPTDATSVTLPRLDGDLQTAVAPPAIASADILLRAIDSSAVDGFAAVVAAGIRAEETTHVSPILEAPVGGQVRVAQSVGGAP